MGESNANPFAVYDIAVKVKECIEPWLETTTKGLPDRSCVQVGNIAWDECECGQLVISVQNNFEANEPNVPRNASPTPGRRACGPPLFTVNLMVSMLRCATEGNPPDCTDLERDARTAVEDAWAIRAGLVCCLDEAISQRLSNGTRLYQDFTVGQQDFVGPQGMCLGSRVPVSVTIQNGCYPCGDVS